MLQGERRARLHLRVRVRRRRRLRRGLAPDQGLVPSRHRDVGDASRSRGNVRWPKALRAAGRRLHPVTMAPADGGFVGSSQPARTRISTSRARRSSPASTAPVLLQCAQQYIAPPSDPKPDASYGAVRPTDDGGVLLVGYTTSPTNGARGIWASKPYAKDGAITFASSGATRVTPAAATGAVADAALALEPRSGSRRRTSPPSRSRSPSK